MRLQVECETPKDLPRHYAEVRKRLNTAYRPAPAVLKPPMQFTVPMSVIGGWFGLEPWFSGRTLRPSLGSIIQAVIKHFGLSERDFLSERRTKDLVIPRQIAMYLCKEMTGAPYPLIAKKMKRHDHTTAMHGYRKIRSLKDVDPNIRKDVADITAKLTGAR